MTKYYNIFGIYYEGDKIAQMENNTDHFVVDFVEVNFAHFIDNWLAFERDKSKT